MAKNTVSGNSWTTTRVLKFFKRDPKNKQTLFNAEKGLFEAKYNYLMSIIKLKYFSGLIKSSDLLEINQFLIE